MSKAFARVTANYRKYAKIPGFRAGKVPESVIKRRFNAEIRKDVIDGNKLAAGREQDILDVKQIQEAAVYAPEQPTKKAGKPHLKKKNRKGIKR